MVESEHAASVTWIELARMLVLKNLRLPEENRDWEEVGQVLRHAVELNPATLECRCWKSKSSLHRREFPERPNASWSDSATKTRSSSSPWIVLASLAERQEEWDKAEKLLNDAKRQLGDKVGLRIARAEHPCGVTRRTRRPR